MKLDPTKRYCPSCGIPLADGEKHDTVTRIVRAGQKYGAAGPGQRVEVEPRHINGVVEAATMSLEEHDMLEAHRGKTAAKPSGTLRSMVLGALDATLAATRAELERGKERMKRAAERAGATAAQALDELHTG